MGGPPTAPTPVAPTGRSIACNNSPKARTIGLLKYNRAICSKYCPAKKDIEGDTDRNVPAAAVSLERHSNKRRQ